ncbi:MAG: hypothetical protein KJI71_01635 [Patescibacteria group bacterium]|nr:hypothetical protein [Patescibacteria group bacterium]
MNLCVKNQKHLGDHKTSRRKIEIEIPNAVYKFFNTRAIIKNKNLEEEIAEFLIREVKALEESTYREAIFS